MLVGWPFASVAKGKCTEQLGVVHLSQVLGKLDLSSLCSVVGLCLRSNYVVFITFKSVWNVGIIVKIR